MKKYIPALAVVNGVVLAAVLALLLTDKNNLIIRLGIVAAQALQKVGWVAAGALFVAGNGVILAKMLGQRKTPTPRQMPIEIFPKDRVDPDYIRQELTRFSQERPALRQQIAEALAQMDSIDRKQAKIGNIFERNQVGSLGEVASTVDDAEHGICLNMVKIINRMILWDPMEWNKPGKEEIYAGHMAYIQKCLSRNEEILSKCDILLSETVSYIDEQNSGSDSKQLHLDVMTETIQSLRQINRIEP